MGKIQTNDLDEQIRLVEKTLSTLKKQKEEQERKTRLIDSNFENLPKSIENIAAHICIRTQEKIFVVFKYLEDCFYIDGDNGDYYFDDNGICKVRDDAAPYAFLPMMYNDSSAVNFRHYFGCVFVPVGEDMYTIESFKIDTKDGSIILDWEE
jgi:hypothetical protein